MGIARVKLAFAVATFALPCTAAFAQTPSPSQVAPPVVAPTPTPARIVLPLAVVGGEIPAGAKALTFFLLGIDIEGEFEGLISVQRELMAGLVGRRVSVADVFQFATRLQAAYVRAGYPLVRVAVLPQELGSRARVKLRVIDGFIERVDSSALSDRVRSRVEAVVGRLIGQRRLTQHEIERRLLIAGDTPGLKLNATFTAGKAIGSSILILSGEHRPLSVNVYADNAVSKAFGYFQVSTLLAANSVLGLGERIMVSAAGYPESEFFGSSPTRRYLSAIVTVPIGTDGWTVEASATKGRTTPRVPAASATQGDLTQGYVQLAYDAIKSRDLELTIKGRLDATDEQIKTLVLMPPAPLSLDRTRVVRFGVDGIWRVRETGTTVLGSATISRGLDIFGARTAADATALLPLSRAGADAVFTKLEGAITVSQNLPLGMLATLFAAGQTSFNRPVLTSEQFSLSGTQKLSGFDAGALAGDRAWVLRGEFGRPFAIANGAAVVTPYLFAATGQRHLESPTVLEQGSVHASNFGAGARLEVASLGPTPVSLSAFVEASHRQSDDRTVTNGTHSGWRVLAGGTLRY